MIYAIIRQIYDNLINLFLHKKHVCLDIVVSVMETISLRPRLDTELDIHQYFISVIAAFWTFKHYIN